VTKHVPIQYEKLGKTAIPDKYAAEGFLEAVRIPIGESAPWIRISPHENSLTHGENQTISSFGEESTHSRLDLGGHGG